MRSPKVTVIYSRIPDNSKINVKLCSQCPGNTEYFCQSCQKEFCYYCKERHVIDLDSSNHEVTIYKGRFNHYIHEKCIKHPLQVLDKYCESCVIPICLQCTEHRRHNILDIKEVYENNLRQCKGIAINLRSKALYNCQVLLSGLQSVVKHDVQICRINVKNHHSEILKRSKKIKNIFDRVTSDPYNRRLINSILLTRKIIKLQNYANTYEECVSRSVKFLRFIKGSPYSRIHELQPFMVDLIQLITATRIEKKGRRHVQDKYLLKLLPSPVFKRSIIVKEVSHCVHISCLTPDKVWISDGRKLMLINTTTGDTIYTVTDSVHELETGLHTVNSDLFYIDNNYNISKLYGDLKTKTVFIKRIDPLWKPQCVHCSLITGDLLVGMWKQKNKTAKVNRYSNTGKLTQTIQGNLKGFKLYKRPIYMTENNNGDIVVSDWWQHAVVVTERGGKHRFSYTGSHLPGSKLFPRGVCTDALSNILLCVDKKFMVHIIDRNGQLLTYLLISKLTDIFKPRVLSYDFTNHLLLAGSGWKSTVSVYRYINRHLPLTGKTHKVPFVF